MIDGKIKIFSVIDEEYHWAKPLIFYNGEWRETIPYIYSSETWRPCGERVSDDCECSCGECDCFEECTNSGKFDCDCWVECEYIECEECRYGGYYDCDCDIGFECDCKEDEWSDCDCVLIDCQFEECTEIECERDCYKEYWTDDCECIQDCWEECSPLGG